MRLELETSLARAAGRLPASPARAAGRRCPGKLLTASIPGRSPGSRSVCRRGSAILSATNGKTTSAAMSPAILSPRFRLAHNAAGANLVSGVASALIAARDAELGLFEVDEAALPELAAALEPRVICLGNLFRDQLDRYGELEIVAERWRTMVDGLTAETLLIVNADDPLVADLARLTPTRPTFGVDDLAQRGATLQHAADSKYCVRCGAPYVYEAAYVGHLGDYRCPACGHSRPPLDVAARSVEQHGIEGISFDLCCRKGRLACDCRCRASTTSTTPSLPRRWREGSGCRLDEVASRARAGGARRSAASSASRSMGSRLVVLLVKNPAGANETLRTLMQGVDGPSVAVVALNDGIADGRDVSWIWDVDFEPLAARLERLVVSGDRAAELALRFSYGGLDESRIEIVPELGCRRSIAGSS